MAVFATRLNDYTLTTTVNKYSKSKIEESIKTLNQYKKLNESAVIICKFS